MEAPGGPGAIPAWGPGRKEGFGTAPGTRSKVWFTIADGNLSDVFFPVLDHPALHGLRFLAAAPGSPPVDDAAEAKHTVRWLSPGVPAFTIESVHHEYALSTEICCDSELSAILVGGSYRPELPDVRLFVQASPHLVPGSEGDEAFILDRDPPVLALRQGEIWIAVVGPFARATTGYLNSSDLYVHLHDNDSRLTALHHHAGPGNVAAGAELGLQAGAFQLAIGFAHSRPDAEEVARQSLQRGMGKVKEEFERGWRAQPDLPRNLLKVAGDGGDLARSSLAVLRCLEDKTHRGAFVAAPAAPWGEEQHDGNHVYHLVWTRDLCQVASALIEAGDLAPAQRALAYLARTQDAAGRWPQNSTLDGRPHWPGVELDQLAHPILLAWRLGMADGLESDPYPELVLPAVRRIVELGPGTPLDRWEDAGGLSPSTLAVLIAALIVAAEFAAEASDHLAAAHLRAVADYWNDRVEPWTFSRPLRHYVRLGSDPDSEPDRDGAVSADFLELVRRGLRAAGDQRIVSSLAMVDALLKVDLPGGPSWRRYWGDAYGEHEDGSAWNGYGRGRPWPLLTGERAHHVLALGEPTADLVKAMESFAGPELLLPEQVWDSADVPLRGLWPGGPTGSARPLGWAHAEYLKLLAAIASNGLPDLVDPVRRRYVVEAAATPRLPDFVWSHAHPITRFQEGRGVRVQLKQPGRVRWTADAWRTESEVEATDTTLGAWVADLPTQDIRPEASIEWTAHYRRGWEGRNHTLTCAGAPS